MKNNKIILSVLASVLITVFSVAIITQAVTTVGNDVAVGGALTVTGTSTMASTLYVNKATGRVGIGTSTPIQELEVIGDINLNTNGTNALFSTYKGANSDGYNIFIGGGGQNSVGDAEDGYKGSSNTAIGYVSLYSNTTGNENTANGMEALYSNTTGEYNTAIGYDSLYSNTTGLSNTVNGAFSTYYNTTGSENTANGSWSLAYNMTGSSNVAMGYEAGKGAANNSNISNSVLLGYEAGKALRTTGDNNILIGYKTGDALTTGAKNIIIGYDIDAKTVNATNTLNIGNLIYGTGLDGSGTTLSTGNIGIGTTTPAYNLEVSSSASTTIMIGSGALTGCLGIGDTDKAGITWCTALDGTLTCSGTKPQQCK